MLIYRHGFPDTLLLLLLALALDPALEGFALIWRFVPHPLERVGAAVSWFDHRLNRQGRSDRTRLVRGILVVISLAVAAAVVGAALGEILRLVRFGWAIEIVIVALLLAQRSTAATAARLLAVVQRAGLLAARDALRPFVARDPESLDEHGVVRAAIEMLARLFCTGVVAPAFYYAVFGLPGLFVYAAASVLAARIGRRSPRYLAFGWAAAKLADLVDYVPARLSGALLGLAALAMPEASGRAAFSTMLRDAGKHRSPNEGWPEAAAAGALGLALSGPLRRDGILVAAPWLGAGRARAEPHDLALALRLYLFACAVQAALLALAIAAAVALGASA